MLREKGSGLAQSQLRKRTELPCRTGMRFDSVSLLYEPLFVSGCHNSVSDSGICLWDTGWKRFLSMTDGVDDGRAKEATIKNGGPRKMDLALQ